MGHLRITPAIMKTVRPTGKCSVTLVLLMEKFYSPAHFQAKSALGIELAGDSLVTKFNAMVNSIKDKTMELFQHRIKQLAWGGRLIS